MMTVSTRSCGSSNKQKEFLVALALWKILCIRGRPFRYRSGRDLECVEATSNDQDVEDALTKHE